ncbi:MAG: FAD binding domain-containing protein [bacterium]|jgi:CO/xanthine dehydrogenase FAD-binding subunit
MFEYFRPSEVQEALTVLDHTPCSVLAGGTDFYPARVSRPVEEHVLDLSGIDALRGVRETEDAFYLGALTTWTDVIRADLPPMFDGLKAAARTVGGVQTQNAGTLCGNICNASPAADSVPNLMALDASVQLRSLQGERTLPLQEFILGNRKTARSPRELVTGLRIPKAPPGTRSRFEKLGARKYLVISIVMVGVVVEPDAAGNVGALRIAVGACAPVARRLHALEAEAQGQPLGDLQVQPRHLQELSPIDDVRASAAYRSEVVIDLIQRALDPLR